MQEKYSRVEISKVKEGIGCAVCGYSEFAHKLHFHHRRGEKKLFTISAEVGRKVSKTKMDEEIRKCIVLCIWCHAREHGEDWRVTETTKGA